MILGSTGFEVDACVSVYGHVCPSPQSWLKGIGCVYTFACLCFRPHLSCWVRLFWTSCQLDTVLTAWPQSPDTIVSVLKWLLLGWNSNGDCCLAPAHLWTLMLAVSALFVPSNQKCYTDKGWAPLIALISKHTYLGRRKVLSFTGLCFC